MPILSASNPTQKSCIECGQLLTVGSPGYYDHYQQHGIYIKPDETASGIPKHMLTG